jgi:hypothetical protein
VLHRRGEVKPCLGERCSTEEGASFTEEQKRGLERGCGAVEEGTRCTEDKGTCCTEEEGTCCYTGAPGGNVLHERRRHASQEEGDAAAQRR